MKWKRSTRTAEEQSPTTEEVRRLRLVAGVEFTAFKDHGWGVVFQLPHPVSKSEAGKIAARIRALPEIVYADPERFFGIKAVWNDPL